MTTPLFEIQDRWGRTIQLEDVVWKGHILHNHSELTEHLDAIQETLIDPDVVTFDINRIDGECFYRHGAIPVATRRSFKVVVQFIGGGDGNVITAYIIRRIQKGEAIKWQK